MSSEIISVCQICWNISSHKNNPTLTYEDKTKRDKSNKQICSVCKQTWTPVQLVKSKGKWVYIRPRPANVPGEFKMCDKKGNCLRGASCTFAHSKEELDNWNRDREGPPMPDKPRPAPIITGNRYMMCTHHSNGKRCLYGAECKFAHSLLELDTWNATIAYRSGDGGSRTSSFSMDDMRVTSPVRAPDEGKRIIPGLPTNVTNNKNSRTRLSSMSSNTSNTSDCGSRNIPLTLSNHSTNSSISKDPLNVYRCETCDCTCTSQKQLTEHKAGAKHKQIARNNSMPEPPVIRPRPSLNSRSMMQYSICSSVEASGRCSFGTGCPNAHSYEELETWNNQLNSTMKAMIPSAANDSSVPFLDKIRQELDSTELTIRDLLEPRAGILIEELSGTATELKHTGEGNLKWVFRITAKEQIQLLGMIMLGEQYPQFSFSSLSLGSTTIHPTTPFGLEAKHILRPGDSFCTEVEFRHQIGCFPQVVIFKFNGFFIGKLLKVTCMTVESHKLQQIHHSQSINSVAGTTSRSNWETVREVVRLDCAELKERDECPTEYPLTPDKIQIRKLSGQLDMSNYCEKLHTLLYIEEMERQSLLAGSNLPNMAFEVSTGFSDDYMWRCAPSGFKYLTFKLDNMDNSQLDLVGRNRICQVKGSESTIAYEGVLELFGRGVLVVRVRTECATDCVEASVRFTQKRKLFKYMHWAIDKVDLRLLFPEYIPDQTSPPEQLSQLLARTNLNEAQSSVVQDILDPSTAHIPCLVCGPFGTGKTSTLVEAVAILLQVNTMSRSLVCTHSNSAADIYIERLDKKFGYEFLKGKVLRHYYHERRAETISDLLKKYTNVSPTTREFELPPLEQLQELSVIVTTIEQAGDLAYLEGLQPGHFTHIFIDEAAQVQECQALIPLQLASYYRDNIRSTKIVLAGDHMQMEEDLVSQEATTYGLNKSLLERLTSVPLYLTTEGRRCRTQLVHNYRTHPTILRLPSELFYESSLIPMCREDQRVVEPLSFHGVQGSEEGDANSFSYQNFMEAREIEELVKRMVDNVGLEESEVCVLTPYTKQCQVLRFLLRKRGLAGVSVHTTKGIQGREYRALFVSTVRTCKSDKEEREGVENNFLNNPKLFNMAITRAKDWLCVVGDPYTLCNVGPNRSCWEKLVRYCIDLNSFHFANATQFIASLSKPHASKLPSISHVSPSTSEPLSDYSESERKQFFKQKLLPIVEKLCPQYAEKVTTVLVEMNTQKMIELFADESELQFKIKKTIEFLELQGQREHPVLRHLTEQLKMLDEHERMVHSLAPHVQANIQATHVLREQLLVIKEQRQVWEKQAHLAMRFLRLVSQPPPPPPPPSQPARLSMVNGNGPSPPMTFPSGSMLGSSSFSPGPRPQPSLQPQAAPFTAPSLQPQAAPFTAPSQIRPPGWNFGGPIGPSVNNTRVSPVGIFSNDPPVISPGLIGAPIFSTHSSSDSPDLSIGSPGSLVGGRNLGAIGER